MKTLFYSTLLVLIISSAAAGQCFSNFSNFQVASETVIWQNVFQCHELTRDSLVSLITAVTKADPKFTLLNNSGDEFTYSITERSFSKNVHINSAKMTIEVKDGRYRFTLSSIEIHGKDPQNLFEPKKQCFRKDKLQYLTELNGEFLKAFDFKKYPAAKSAAKDF